MKDKILIVEDEPSIADNMIYALSTEGFEPVWAATGQAALMELAEGTMALMLLDVGLPDINGFDLAKKVRQSSALPIIFVTARGDEIDRVLGLELGGDDYVVKPFSPRELSARVKAVLRRTVVVAEPTSVAGTIPHSTVAGFTIYEEQYAIHYCEMPLALSRTEYRLLKTLIASPGRVYSRAQLMAVAWQHADISLERTVDTHIKTIRHKLRAVNDASDPIITHRGIGYSIAPDLSER